jgi:hypothetical protein
LRFFNQKLLPALFRQPVVLELAIAIRGRLPLRSDPSLPFQTVQSWLERTVLHLQEIICCSLDMLADVMPMGRAVEECPKDEHV